MYLRVEIDQKNEFRRQKELEDRRRKDEEDRRKKDEEDRRKKELADRRRKEEQERLKKQEQERKKSKEWQEYVKKFHERRGESAAYYSGVEARDKYERGVCITVWREGSVQGDGGR